MVSHTKPRERGTALLVVMLVLLMLSALAAVLLEGSNASARQATALRNKTQADLIADAGLRHALLLLEGSAPPDLSVPYVTWPVTGAASATATPSGDQYTRSFGGGQYAFRIVQSTVGTTRYRIVTVWARVESARGVYEHGEIEVTLRTVPPTVDVPGAITVDTGARTAGVPSWGVSTTAHGSVDGADRGLDGAVDPAGTDTAGIALTNGGSVVAVSKN